MDIGLKVRSCLQAPSFDLTGWTVRWVKAYCCGWEGTVYVRGGRLDGAQPAPIPAGSRVKVIGREGLALLVEALQQETGLTCLQD